MSTAIAGKKLSTKPAEPDDRQRARQSKRHPDCRSTTIKLTAHANIACVIVGPRQSSSRRDRRNGHPDCRCVPIQIVALQTKSLADNKLGEGIRLEDAIAFARARDAATIFFERKDTGQHSAQTTISAVAAVVIRFGPAMGTD